MPGDLPGSSNCMKASGAGAASRAAAIIPKLVR